MAHRYLTPFAEIDLLMKSPAGEICLIEVKSILSWDRLSCRMSRRQKLRLRRALCYLAEKHEKCLLLLAVVGSDGEVLVFDDVFGSN